MNIIDLSEKGFATHFETSVCVVGSGPGGAFAAVELASAGHDVLVVEAGSSIAEMDPDKSIGSISVAGGASLRFSFSCQLGGSSNVWAGRIAPLEPIDFEKRDWVPDSGWPIGYQDLAPHYDRAAEIMGLPYPRFMEPSTAPAPEAFSSLWSDGVGSVLDVKRFFWADPPFNTGTYLKSAIDRYDGRLRLLIGARVRRLQHGSDSQQISHAEVAAPDGRRLTVAARYFVLAAGGIETPRILLNSTSAHPEGIGNRNDVVGRYFATHPKADMGVLMLNRRVSTASPLFSDYTVDGGRVRHGLGFSATKQTEHRGLNHYVQLSPVLEYRANRLFEAVKGSTALNSSFIDRNRIVRGALPGLGLVAYEALGRVAGLQRRARMFMMRAFLDQYPDRENRISLSTDLDQFGDAKVDVKWKLTAQDRQSVLAFFSQMDWEFRTRGLGHVETTLIDMEDWPLTGVHSHFMGTTRMGEDPKHAVVDRNCRVFGTKNLFISGPSTFPTSGYANPFFSITALSLRLGEHLKRCLQASH